MWKSKYQAQTPKMKPIIKCNTFCRYIFYIHVMKVPKVPPPRSPTPPSVLSLLNKRMSIVEKNLWDHKMIFSIVSTNKDHKFTKKPLKVGACNYILYICWSTMHNLTMWVLWRGWNPKFFQANKISALIMVYIFRLWYVPKCKWTINNQRDSRKARSDFPMITQW